MESGDVICARCTMMARSRYEHKSLYKPAFPPAEAQVGRPNTQKLCGTCFGARACPLSVLLALITMHTESPKESRHCHPPVYMQKRTCSNISIRHLIPLCHVPKDGVPESTVRSVDMTQIRKRNSNQISSGDLGMRGPTADDGHCR